MQAALQRRVQRYGWDRAAAHYEPAWQAQLAPAQARLLARAAPAPGERVLDVACGTGLLAFAAAAAVGPQGHVVGVDLSGAMIAAAQRRALESRAANVRFLRMDAEALDLPEACFDAALCGLGLMYMPDPARAVREMRRVLRPGGRIAIAVWGERARCGFAPLFEIVDAEVASEVCPLFFRLGGPDALVRLCAAARCEAIEQQRIAAPLLYATADDACRAAFAAGPVALAWSRFSAASRARAKARYVEAIAPWRSGGGYRIPGEFVVVNAVVPGGLSPRKTVGGQ